MAIVCKFKGQTILPAGYTKTKPFEPERLKDEEFKCAHSFKIYSGFKESYKYCTKCDKKENL